MVNGEPRTAPDRRLVLLVLIATAISSIFHYTDNFVRFDEYPQDDPELVSKASIPVYWLLFTAFGVLGYFLVRRGSKLPAAACLAVYAVSGLVSPLHYLHGSLSDFDGFQHAFIVSDGLLGLCVLLLAAKLATARQPARITPG